MVPREPRRRAWAAVGTRLARAASVSSLRGVSIVMPAFDAAATIVDSVASALDALGHLDGVDGEIVVVDDGSTDDTGVRLEGAFGDDARVRVYRHRRNRGGAAARNSAV